MRALLVLVLAGGRRPPEPDLPAGGRYRFQCDPPEHIHMLISAAGYEPLASIRYHPEGRASGVSTSCSSPRAPDGWRLAGALG